MENLEVKETLASIVRQQGASVIDDTPRLQGLLKDLAGGYRREINILMSAQRTNVPQELLRTSGPTAITAQRLVDRLQDETGLSLDAARWAVETWGNAIGVSVTFDSPDEPATVAPTPTFSPEPPAPISAQPSTPATTPLASPPYVSTPPVSHSQPPQPQPVAPQPWNPPKSKAPMVTALVAVAVIALGGGGAFYFMKRGAGGTSGGSTGLTTTTGTIGPVGTTNGGTNAGDTSVTAGATGTTSGTTSGTTAGTGETTAGTGGTTTALGTMEGGRFVATDGSFSFTPPEGWDMRMLETETSVQWQNPEDENLGVMDLRSAKNDGKSLDDLAKSATETLKTQMSFNPLNTSDTTLATEPCKIITGTIKGNGNEEMMMAVALSIHAGQTVVITMGAKKDAFGKAVPTLDASLASWSWR